MAKSALSKASMKFSSVGCSGGSSEAMSRLPPVSGLKAATSIHRNGVVHTKATLQSSAALPSCAGCQRMSRLLCGMIGAAFETLEADERQRQQDGDADHRRRRRLARVVEFVGVLVDVIEQEIGRAVRAALGQDDDMIDRGDHVDQRDDRDETGGR